jgi:PTH2 family peptidyl-tRNA hydrolase
MRKGKIGAQVAHAAMAFITKQMVVDYTIARPAIFMPYETHKVKISLVEQEWLDNYYTKIVVGINSEEELLELLKKAHLQNISCYPVYDCGKTEFHGASTLTCMSFGPDEEEKLDPLTGHLPLL